jgi:hypothetical protein
MKRNYTPALMAVITALAVALGSPAFASLSTQNLSQGLTPTDVANALVGAGITISNVTYTGATVAAGTFSGGAGTIGFDQGVILSSGCIANAIGPNTSNSITCSNGTPGDTELTALAGVSTFDAAVLAFDFVPNADKVFGSCVATVLSVVSWPHDRRPDRRTLG